MNKKEYIAETLKNQQTVKLENLVETIREILAPKVKAEVKGLPPLDTIELLYRLPVLDIWVREALAPYVSRVTIFDLSPGYYTARCSAPNWEGKIELPKNLTIEEFPNFMEKIKNSLFSENYDELDF